MIYQLLGNIRKRRAIIRTNARIRKYLKSGCKPYTAGYKEYKKKILCDALNDRELLERFCYNKTLPANYGFRIGERVVEYLWLISRLDYSKHLLLDGGSALNHDYILDHPILRNRSIVIYSLSPEGVIKRNNISYIYGDLRHTIFQNECFDEIACISTLEHVGMNNTFLYTQDPRFNESRVDDYQVVIREFNRLLRPGGKLFVTIPYGRYENHGWLQQFDNKMVKTVIDVFAGASADVTYFKYFADGWQIADTNECDACSYFDIHNADDYESDYVAAARAVACIEMTK